MMKLTPLLLLLPLCACAGGPVTTDAEVAWLLEENSAADQRFAADADAAQLALIGQALDALAAALRWLAAESGHPLPPHVETPLASSAAALAGHQPPPPAQPPVTERPSDGEGFWGALLGALTNPETYTGAGIAAAAAAAFVQYWRGPSEKKEKIARKMKAKPPSPPSAV